MAMPRMKVSTTALTMKSLPGSGTWSLANSAFMASLSKTRLITKLQMLITKPATKPPSRTRPTLILLMSASLLLLVSPSMLDHDIDILQQSDVAQHVATHGNDVGIFSFTDCSDL